MLIFKKPKMNDFLVGTATRRGKPSIAEVCGEILCYSVGSKGTYYSNMRASVRDQKVYVYHAEKIRPKFKQEIIGKRVKKKVSTRVRDGGWKMRIFAFPADRVKSVQQHARHFTMVLN